MILVKENKQKKVHLIQHKLILVIAGKKFKCAHVFCTLFNSHHLLIHSHALSIPQRNA